MNEYKFEINQINDMFKVFIKNLNEEIDNYNKLFNKMMNIY